MDMDEWTSCSNLRFMNVSLFTPTNEYWNLSLVQITGSATAEYLLELLQNKLLEFGIVLKKDVVSITSDGAKVMVKIQRISPVSHQLCYAHAIQLAVTDSLYKKKKSSKPKEQEENCEDDEEVDTGIFIDKESPASIEKVEMINKSIDESIDKIRKLATFFKRSAYNNEKLQNFVKSILLSKTDLPLKIDCPTRWNSLFFMMDRFWQIRDCIDHTLMLVPNTNVEITEKDKFIYWNVLRTLEPVLVTVEVTFLFNSVIKKVELHNINFTK